MRTRPDFDATGGAAGAGGVTVLEDEAGFVRALGFVALLLPLLLRPVLAPAEDLRIFFIVVPFDCEET